MKNLNVATTTAGVLGIVQSTLLLAWDIFFLFVQFQPSVFGESHIRWLFCFEEVVEGFEYGINGIVIVSTILNFIWLINSIAALLSNNLSQRNASGLRIWIGTTACIILSDIALTIFFIFSTTVVFRDLFRDEKEFVTLHNSTTFLQVDFNEIVYLDNFSNKEIYQGYIWFLVGVSRVFLVTVFINALLIYFANKRIREIRFGFSQKREPQDIRPVRAFGNQSQPNMYSEPASPINEYDEPIFDSTKSKVKESPVLYEKLPIDQRRNGAARRISARNYDLKPDVLPNSRELSRIPPTAPIPHNSSPPPRIHNFSREIPNIPDPDYDDLPLKVYNYWGKSEQMGIDNPAMNPTYDYPYSNAQHQQNKGSFTPVSDSSNRNSYNSGGPHLGNVRGLRRY